MPNRIVLEAWLKDPRRLMLSVHARELLSALVLVVDDERIHEADAGLIRSYCYPRQTEPPIQVVHVQRWLDELIALREPGRVVTHYEVAGRWYVQIREGIMLVKYAVKRRKHPPPPDEQGRLNLVPPESDRKFEEKISPLVAVESESESGDDIVTESVVPASELHLLPRETATRATRATCRGSDSEKRERGVFWVAREAIDDPLWHRLYEACGACEMHDSGRAWQLRFEFCRDTINTLLRDLGEPGRVRDPAAYLQAAWDRSPAGKRMAEKRA